ncbi:MAG: hypothetical protein HN411_03960 [Waddliaceae bacterium]|nr:hypothetical protein [Waddliaceae bacterium]MBT3579200.1 hypothetical protein [Waddliaceae bacterium]MBT4444740.1 hypothetical protein [Waddliaceae bacterium]MBT6928900.1 hypothetical protein [Waddliaceae bacterium]MBT7264147.1 hypothetical protein [Waddliaceae bacterium]
MKYLLLSLCCSLLFLTLYASDNSYFGRDPEHYKEGNKLINEMFREYAERVCKQYDLKCEGDMGGFPGQIQSLGGVFGVKRLLAVDELRILILKLLADFQDTINRNEKIRPFLAEYPFAADRITIMLRIYDGNKRPSPDEISLAFSSRDHISYCYSDPKKSIFEDKKIQEPFEEACEKAGIDVATISPIYSLYDDTGRFLKTEKNDNPTTKKK